MAIHYLCLSVCHREAVRRAAVFVCHNLAQRSNPSACALLAPCWIPPAVSNFATALLYFDQPAFAAVAGWRHCCQAFCRQTAIGHLQPFGDPAPSTRAQLPSQFPLLAVLGPLPRPLAIFTPFLILLSASCFLSLPMYEQAAGDSAMTFFGFCMVVLHGPACLSEALTCNGFQLDHMADGTAAWWAKLKDGAPVATRQVPGGTPWKVKFLAAPEALQLSPQWLVLFDCREEHQADSKQGGCGNGHRRWLLPFPQ